MSTPQPPHASPTPHLDVDTLADLQEGLLEPDRAAIVATHLLGCAECQAARDALDDVRELLRDHGSGADDATPGDVVGRLDAALAAAGPAVAAPSATVTALTTRDHAPWSTRALQAAAVFVLIAAVGGLGYGGIKAISSGNGSADGATSSASGGAGRKAASESAGGSYSTTDSGRDYSEASLKAAVPELLAGTLPHVAKDLSTGSGDAAASPKPATTATSSPTASSSAPVTAAAGAGRLLNGTALATCVANLVGGPVTPLAVDFARFEKKTATIIVLPAPDEPAFVDVYAVAPDCPTGSFLYYARVSRP
jgi:hypothetical protein